MTAQPPIFVDCPYGGCEDGYCACLEQDLDDAPNDELEPEDPDDKQEPFPAVVTVPISIDDYEPPKEL